MKIKNKKIIFAFILLFIVSAFFFKSNSRVLQEEEIKTKFIFSKTSGGFDIEEGRLTFGMISPRGSASRNVEVKNTFEEKIKISITSLGEVAPYIIVSENDFFLGPGESKDLTFSVVAPNNEEYKIYQGIVKISSLKP